MDNALWTCVLGDHAAFDDQHPVIGTQPFLGHNEGDLFLIGIGEDLALIQAALDIVALGLLGEHHRNAVLLGAHRGQRDTAGLRRQHHGDVLHIEILGELIRQLAHQGIMEVTPEFLGEQLDNIFTDIYPDAVKIGMVSSSGLITKIADKLKEYDAKNIVVDPVMVATSGARLISEEAIDALKSCLLPMATVLTPNIPEAEVLAGMKIQSQADMIRAAEEIGTKYHCAVLCKGGHQLNDANDLLWRDGGYKWFYGERIDNPNTHGTGCTLSSAIASNLAKEYDLDESVERAKKYISGALAAMLDLGKGSGPMNHGFAIKNEYTESKVEE